MGTITATNESLKLVNLAFDKVCNLQEKLSGFQENLTTIKRLEAVSKNPSGNLTSLNAVLISNAG